MNKILVFGMIALFAVAIMGLGSLVVDASSENVPEVKTCGSCAGSCSSSSGCGQASCQMETEGSCGCANRT
jgi:hypothetical protein